MRIFFILLLAGLSSFPAIAAEKVRFSGEITEHALNKFQQKITKKALKMPATGDRTIVLDLDSGGGNLYATMRFVAGIPGLSKALNIVIHTRVRSECESACTVLFTAGTERIASKRARFGFHSPGIASRLPRGTTRSDVLTSARVKWLEYIGAVDLQLATDLERNGFLLHDDMTYLRSLDLLHGYVTLLE